MLRRALFTAGVAATTGAALLTGTDSASAASGGGCSAWTNGGQACISYGKVGGVDRVIPDGYWRGPITNKSCVIVIGIEYSGRPGVEMVSPPQDCQPGHKRGYKVSPRKGAYTSTMYVYLEKKLVYEMWGPTLRI